MLLSLTGLCAAALPAQAGITTLASFTGSGDIGSGPYAGVTFDSSGNLFGTTTYGSFGYQGSTTGYGTVYEIAQGSSTLTTLASFTGVYVVWRCDPAADIQPGNRLHNFGHSLS